MKYLILIAAVAFMGCADNDAATVNENNQSDVAATPTAGADSTTVEWLDPVVQELGKAKEGQVLEISWRFKNTGNAPLIVSDVKAGCGCTVAEKPQQPVPPGEEGTIKAKFDTKGQLYTQQKNVYVRANNTNKTGSGEDVLGFKVEVEKQ